jgi:hypothetical protein
MSILSRLLPIRRCTNTQQRGDKCTKSSDFFPNTVPDEPEFAIVPGNPRFGDGYLYSAWVNIAVSILIRNTARAAFVIKKGGDEVTGGPLYELFRRPNTTLSRYDLWKETAAWWNLEGEAFWWFGPNYAGGLPKELYVLNPRRLRHEGYDNGETDGSITVASWIKVVT